MTTYPTTVLTGEAVRTVINFKTPAVSAATEECCADISEAQGLVYVLLDATACTTAASVTVHAGKDASAVEYTFDALAGSNACMAFSTRDIFQDGGMMHFSITGDTTNLSALKPRVAVLVHRNVENH